MKISVETVCISFQYLWYIDLRVSGNAQQKKFLLRLSAERSLQSGKLHCKQRTDVGAGGINKIDRNDLAVQSILRIECLTILIYKRETRCLQADSNPSGWFCLCRTRLMRRDDAWKQRDDQDDQRRKIVTF